VRRCSRRLTTAQQGASVHLGQVVNQHPEKTLPVAPPPGFTKITSQGSGKQQDRGQQQVGTSMPNASVRLPGLHQQKSVGHPPHLPRSVRRRKQLERRKGRPTGRKRPRKPGQHPAQALQVRDLISSNPGRQQSTPSQPVAAPNQEKRAGISGLLIACLHISC